MIGNLKSRDNVRPKSASGKFVPDSRPLPIGITGKLNTPEIPEAVFIDVFGVSH
jgi:hypothetical protein